MKQCTKCNLTHDDTAKFCQGCGQPLPDAQVEVSEQKEVKKEINHKPAKEALIGAIGMTIMLYGFSFIYTDFEGLGLWLPIYFGLFGFCVLWFIVVVTDLILFFKQKVVTAQAIVACIFAFISLIFILLNFSYLSDNVQLYRQWRKAKEQGWGYYSAREVQLIDYSR